MCPDLSHPISLIGRIIPPLSNTALFHLWGHIDVNPHLGVTTQETSQLNINVKKFDAAHACLFMCNSTTEKFVSHGASLGRENIPFCLLNRSDDTASNSSSCVVLSNTCAANNVGVPGHEL